MKAGAALAAVLAATVVQQAAAAEPAAGQELARQYQDLDSQLRFVEREYFRPDESEAERAHREFSEAEARFLLHNWRAAIVLLYDATDLPDFRASPEYGPALYYLGESLFQEGEYRTARLYFHQLLAIPDAPHQREALLRALEIAVTTGDSQGMGMLLERAKDAFPGRPPAEFAYLAAKAVATRRDLPPEARRREAIDAFAAVSAPYDLQAAYWQGVLYAEGGDLPRAAESLQACLAKPADNPRLREVHEICAMGLGRVDVDRGRFQEAIDAYQEVARDSPRFAETLYEMAWAWVRAAKYEQALHTVEFVTDLYPESQLAPEATILEGHLYLRLGRFDEAIESYDKVVNQYAPVRDEIDSLLSMQEDPVRYFNEILSSQDKPVDVTAVLPPVAVRWATTQRDVSRALAVVAEVDSSHRELADGHVLSNRLDAILLRNDGLDAVGAVKEGYGRAEAVENGTLWLEGRVLDEEEKLLAPQLAPQGQLEPGVARARAARRELERKVQTLPRTPAEVSDRQERIRARFAELGRQAFQLGFTIEASNAALAGTRSWLDQQVGDAKTAEGRAEMQDELRRQEEVVAGYSKDLAALEGEIDRAADSVAGLEGAASDTGLREAYQQAIAVESDEIAPARPKVAGPDHPQMEQLEGLRAELPELMARAARVQTALRGQARNNATSIRAQVAAERQRLDEVGSELVVVQHDTKDLVGQIALDSFRRVRAQFSELVLKADVGMVDVSWQGKRERIEKIQQLAAEKASDLSHMEEDYKSVLEEAP